MSGMRCALLAVLSGVLCGLLASQAPAADGAVPALLVQKRCNACHDLKSKVIGPPYLAIALRHAPRREVMVEVLARKILLGGGGSWGVVPMVPNDSVTPQQARAMAEWILSLAPAAARAAR